MSRDRSVLERLTQRLERRPVEFGELVQEDDAAMREHAPAIGDTIAIVSKNSRPQGRPSILRAQDVRPSSPARPAREELGRRAPAIVQRGRQYG